MRLTSLLLILLAACASPHVQTRVLPLELARGAVSVERLRRTISELAADEMKGRKTGTPEAIRAAERIAEWMGEAGLRPVGPEGFLLPFTSGRLRGVNVAGLLEGGDPELKREVVVVCAHHDHLGVNENGVHNGADDNASGVAMLLELARAAAYLPRKRSILFVSFDGEEVGLLGSRAFVRSGPFDPGSFIALICLDLVGGDFYPGDDRGLYALGAESSPELDRLVRAEAAVEPEVHVKPIGIYAIEPIGPILARSDYASFRSARVPFVFFSTGTPWYYHTPYDDPERINYHKLVGNARFILRILAVLCDDPHRPTFEPDPPMPGGDARLFAGELERILAVPELPFEAEERNRLGAVVEELRREQDPPTDNRVRELVQRSMMTLLGVIQRYRPDR